MLSTSNQSENYWNTILFYEFILEIHVGLCSVNNLYNQELVI